MEAKPQSAVIYYHRGIAEVAAQINELRKKSCQLLEQHQIKYSEVDVSNDLDTKKRISSVSKKKTYPIIYIGDKCIGDFDDLTQWFENPEPVSNKEKVESNPEPEEKVVIQNAPIEPIQLQEAPALNELQKPNDAWEDIEDHVVEPKNVVQPQPKEEIHNLPINDDEEDLNHVNEDLIRKEIDSAKREENYIGYFADWTGQAMGYMLGYEMKKSNIKDLVGDGEELFVVHKTNWYGRKEVRLIKLGNNEYQRLRTDSPSVAASHKYTEIQKVTIDYENNSFEIMFLDNTTEKYESKHKEEIIKSILDRAKTLGNKSITKVLIKYTPD